MQLALLAVVLPRMNNIMLTRIGISTTTNHAPSRNLTLVTTTATTAVAVQPIALMTSR